MLDPNGYLEPIYQDVRTKNLRNSGPSLSPMLKRCYILHNQHGTKNNGGVIKIPQSKVGVSPEKGPVQKDLKYLPTINFQGGYVSFQGSKYIYIYMYTIRFCILNRACSRLHVTLPGCVDIWSSVHLSKTGYFEDLYIPAIQSHSPFHWRVQWSLGLLITWWLWAHLVEGIRWSKCPSHLPHNGTYDGWTSQQDPSHEDGQGVVIRAHLRCLEAISSHVSWFTYVLF